MRVRGSILWFKRQSGIGVIIIRGQGLPERFFLHRNQIIRGPEFPALDSVVLFTPSNQEPKPGQLRSALAVEILDEIEPFHPESPEQVEAPKHVNSDADVDAGLSRLAGTEPEKETAGGER